MVSSSLSGAHRYVFVPGKTQNLRFHPLSYILLSHEFSLAPKCNETHTCPGTAASETGAGVFREEKYTHCTGEAQAREGCGSSLVIYVHSFALSSVGTVQNSPASGSWAGVSIPS